MDSDLNFTPDFLNLLKETRDFERIKEILEDSFLYHAADKSGVTLLHHSARYPNVNLTSYLLDKGCDVNVQDSKGNTPLMIAVKENNEVIMKLLLSAGADIFKRNNKKKGALRMLSEHRTMSIHSIRVFLRELSKKCSTTQELAKKLLDARCPLYHAALLKDFKLIEHMIERGSQVDSAHPNLKITALHLAVIHEDLKSLMVLLKHGADVNALDRLRASPLYNLYGDSKTHTSAKMEILKTLLIRGAEMTSSCTSHGLFQVDHALRSGSREAIRVLIESGLDFNVKDAHSGRTVLHYLAKNLKPEVVEELKLHTGKFDVDVRNTFGQTPLYFAVLNGNVGMVKFLLKQGAKTDLKHKIDGTTPLYCAYDRANKDFEERYRECGELLLRHGADPQVIAASPFGEGVTIFDASLSRGDVDRIKSVVAHLAMLERGGTKIRRRIREKINSNDSLKRYFDKCRRLLAEKMSERVVLFDLLSSDSRKMARYLNNEGIADKLRNFNYVRKIKKFQYYARVLNDHYDRGRSFKKLKNIAARMISKIFRGSVDNDHLIVDKVIDHLNDQSLRNLCQLYHNLGSHRRGIVTARYASNRKRKFSEKSVPEESEKKKKVSKKVKTISSKDK